MPKLPTLRGERIVQIFESFGWIVARRRGSHIIMIKKGHIATLSVPNHKEVAIGTLHALLRTANITASEFLDALK